MKNAKATVEKFFDLLCKKDVDIDEFESLIQASYKRQQDKITGTIDKSIVWDKEKKEFVSNKDRSKIIQMNGWQSAITNLLNKKPKSYRILRRFTFGVNMIRIEIEIATRFMNVIYSYPNMIRENGVWQINPISAFPKKRREK